MVSSAKPRMITSACYASVVDTLVDRIKALVPAHPKLLYLNTPFGLFGIPGFQCDDLQPSLAQAGAALSIVRTKTLTR